MYVATIKNMYDLDIITAVSDDKLFVSTTGCNWVEIDDSAKPGEYLIDGKVVGMERDNYFIVEKIIFEIEEKERIIREKQEQEERDRIERELAKLENDQTIEGLEDQDD